MSSLQPYLIAGSDAGLETDKKSFLLPDKAFPTLENAYVWRDRVKKREGLKLIGRLRRVLAAGQALGNNLAGATTTIADIFTTLGITGENAEIQPGSLVITVAAPDANVFTDQGDGTFTVSGAGLGTATGSYINYATGEVVLAYSGVGATGGAAMTCAINYYPSLPVMGIIMRERSNINFEQTLVWDTKYCYAFDGTNYNEFLPATSTTWNGSNSQFFWGTNYRGSDASVRQLFVTNFNLDKPSGNPMRYTDAISWTDFEPAVSSTQVSNESMVPGVVTPWTSWSGNTASFPIMPGTVTITVSNGVDPDVIFTDPAKDGTLKGSASTNTGGTINYTTGAITLPTISPAMTADATVTINYKYQANQLFSAKILLPYYGRLLAFNTFEGPDRNGSKQYFNRVRFSQVGDPTQVGAWDSTIFGRGGFIDAPTNEEIISAIFYKNTMIVFFEKTTWQLRYVGDYGLPFVWERISSDLGSESQFSTILFDEGVLGVGDRAIISSNAQGVQRIDLKIPDMVFTFKNQNQGTERIHGIRDFQKEIVYWCFNDATDTGTAQVFPNKSLLYNYRNDTWAILRNNITAFGRYYGINGITWDRLDVFWNDFDVYWKDPDGQTQFPFIICGNQQGFIHFLNYTTKDEESLSITAVDRTVIPPRLTITNHNLIDGDIIYVEDLDFIDTSDSSDVTTDLNDETYRVETLVPYDADIIKITKWNSTTQTYEADFSYTPASGTGTYIGQGKATLLPKMQIVTKDFNPFLSQGKQLKLGYIDFLTQETPSGVVSVNLYADTTVKEAGNLSVGQTQLQTQDNPLFKVQSADLAWNRFFSTLFGQFISAEITYNDDQMNDRDVLDQPFVLSALMFWVKPGGRLSP